MNNDAIIYPFTNSFLTDFSFAPSSIKMDEETLKKFDQTLTSSIQLSANPDLEKALISRNELFASFAISKAENSTLTLKEAEDVHTLLINNPEYDFLSSKLNNKEKLTQKDHDKLEFFNIVKTFRKYNQKVLPIIDFNFQMIKNIHSELTFGLDIFAKHITGFYIYKSGEWRDNDLIRVGSYKPAHHQDVESGINELLSWFANSDQSLVNLGIFHTALYALHPFNNGNKRVCRILEHLLLRSIGYNQNNLYSPSYYYHTQKERYYKYLLYSLQHHNLNHFTYFVIEAISFAMLDVLKTSIEIKNVEFLEHSQLDTNIQSVIKPLIKRGEIQFKSLEKLSKRKVARQTLITYLQKAQDQNIINRRAEGKKVYYSLAADQLTEKAQYSQWLKIIQAKLSFIPPEFRQV